jgi:hypothetical protein
MSLWRGSCSNANDQARGGYDAVIRAEHGGTQPSDALDQVIFGMVRRWLMLELSCLSQRTSPIRN